MKRMIIKRIISVLAVILTAFILFTGCSRGEGSSSGAEQSLPTFTASEANGQKISVTLRVRDEYMESLFDSTVVIEGSASPTAGMATQTLDIIPFELKDGQFISFNNIPNREDTGWVLYLNGEKVTQDVLSQPIQDGDVLEWKFENFDETRNQ